MEKKNKKFFSVPYMLQQAGLQLPYDGRAVVRQTHGHATIKRLLIGHGGEASSRHSDRTQKQMYSFHKTS